LDKRELTIAEAAARTGYSKRHIARLCTEGTVKGHRVGQRVYLVDAASLDAYTQRMRELGTEKHAPA